MVIGPRQLKKGSVRHMSGRSPRGGKTKKKSKLTLKEKREAKRERADEVSLKPRKTR
jgi:hypothetical protein